jgi:hypothetical protein
LDWLVTLVCQCGQRLAVLGVRSDLPHLSDCEVAAGVYFARARRGDRDIAKDWLRVICRRCRRDWRGREGPVAALVRSALARGARSATLA